MHITNLIEGVFNNKNIVIIKLSYMVLKIVIIKNFSHTFLVIDRNIYEIGIIWNKKLTLWLIFWLYSTIMRIIDHFSNINLCFWEDNIMLHSLYFHRAK
jgi:hypothetical protein